MVVQLKSADPSGRSSAQLALACEYFDVAAGQQAPPQQGGAGSSAEQFVLVRRAVARSVAGSPS